MKARFSFYAVVLLLSYSIGGIGKVDGQTVTVQGRDFLSPEIVFVNPSGNLKVDRDTMVLKGVVLSYKLPITEITFLLNGTLISKQKSVNQTRYEFSVPFVLRPGTNVVTVIAANAKASSKRDSPEITYGTSLTFGKPNLALLVIGISGYKGSALPFAESDAREVAEKITKQQGCVFQTIHTNLIIGGEASRAGIVKGLRWLNETAPADSDVRMLFISGHSARDSRGGHYFLSQDYLNSEDFELSAVSLDLVFSKLAAVHNRAFLFMDAPYSGRSYDLTPSGPQQVTAKPAVKYGSENVTAFLGSTNGASFGSERLGHSAFTLALLEAINGKADSSQDKRVDVDELHRWLAKRITDLTKGTQELSFFDPYNGKPQSVFCTQP